MPEYIQVKLFSSTFLVTLEPDIVRQVTGVRDGLRVARTLEPSVLTNHILSLVKEHAARSVRQERGVKRVIQ